jgi:NAD dependent epimerase/dehydratase family enzyme
MKYNSPDEALKSLARKGIFAKGNTLYIPEHPSAIGNKTYGTLDYLVNYCGYTVIDQRKDEESKGKLIKASRYQGSSKRDVFWTSL